MLPAMASEAIKDVAKGEATAEDDAFNYKGKNVFQKSDLAFEQCREVTPCLRAGE